MHLTWISADFTQENSLELELLISNFLRNDEQKQKLEWGSRLYDTQEALTFVELKRPQSKDGGKVGLQLLPYLIKSISQAPITPRNQWGLTYSAT